MSMNSDPALWEMFRAEVDTHMTALNDGLLALEKDPSQSGHFDSLMRAAHSIKGAAKIVGIPTAVEVAHALEDCFVGARDGRLSMSSSLVDVLFEGVDLLGRVAQDDSSAVAVAEAPKVRELTEKLARATRIGKFEDESTGPATATTAHVPARDVNQPTQVFRPAKSFDASWVANHHREVAAALRQASAEVCFDFSDVEVIDPVGLALLSTMEQSLAMNAMTDKIEIKLSSVSSQLAGLLQATGLDRGCQIVAAEG